VVRHERHRGAGDTRQLHVHFDDPAIEDVGEVYFYGGEDSRVGTLTACKGKGWNSQLPVTPCELMLAYQAQSSQARLRV
jgi:hypothetical protein